jgi:NADH-quinone oxidoreductase subunit D
MSNDQHQPVRDEWETESLKTEHLTLNMGPQHPATHGVLRIEIQTDSEIVVAAKPHLGYLHRCMEKHSENIDYRGIIPFVDRMDYLAAMNMELGYALAVEKMLKLEIPNRANYIRVMVAELNRIASHLMFFGTYLIDLGAFSPFLYAFQEREQILRLFEEVSGARLLYNYIWIGGVWNDFTDENLEFTRVICDRIDKETIKYKNLVTGNKIFQERVKNVGIMNEEMCYQYGASGPVLRGAGVNWDLRKNKPYCNYDKFNFNVPVADETIGGVVGDCWARYWVRMQEIDESVKIIRQCLDGIEEGSIMAKVPKVIKLPEGEVFSRTECPRGELGYHLISTGEKTPYRLKVKSPCFTHVSMLPAVAPGQMIGDFVATVGSIDIVLGEVDR